MKKKLLLVLSLLLTGIFSLQALAGTITASYSDGILYYSVKDYAGRGEIWISTIGSTGWGVTGTMSSQKSISLPDGVYTITASGAQESISTTFRVGPEPTVEPTVAPTVTPTIMPTVEPTVEPNVEPTVVPTVEPTVELPTGELSISAYYKNGVINFNIQNAAQRLEIWVDGNKTDKAVQTSGSYTLQMALSEGNHTILASGSMQSDSAVFTVPKMTMGASYNNNGVLSINVQDITSRCEVWVDGEKTILGIENAGSYSLAIELSHGNHEITLSGSRQSASAGVFAHVHETVKGKEPTCTEDGLTDGSKCSVCGEILEAQKPIEKLDHTPEVTEGKEPTCTEDGCTAEVKCSVCGEILTSSEPIPALGHEIVIDPAVPATCTEDGLTEGSHCKYCDDMTVPQQTVPALGHHYVFSGKNDQITTYVCTNCGALLNRKNQEPVDNLYGKIVKDADGKDVEYEANTNQEDETILVIVADTSDESLTSEKGLYINAELLERFADEGFEKINFVNGETGVIIDLAEITNSAFPTDEKVDTYIVSTDPAIEGEKGVKLEALLEGGDRIAADTISGVFLKTEDGDVEITANA